MMLADLVSPDASGGHHDARNNCSDHESDNHIYDHSLRGSIRGVKWSSVRYHNVTANTIQTNFYFVGGVSTTSKSKFKVDGAK